MPTPKRSVARALGLCALLVAIIQSTNQQSRAQCGPNPIVCENLNPGAPDSEWDISGAGDSSIQGYATTISVNKGETVRFKVDTPAATFNIDIYRLGYYAGAGARKIASITNVAGRNQPNCLTNSSTGLIDCGNWIESASWSVPATAVSGVYIAKLRRVDNGGASHVVFVVRDDQGAADILFQTSDTTWQAYNTYGGNSLYVGGPATNPSRAYKVSYNRPVTTRGTTPEDYLFNAEYPTIRYLEANGFNVSYSSGVETERTGATELLEHRIFLSVGHDEYWSGPQRANVEAARAAGVSLAFFSGNEVFWKTRWENSIDGSNTPYRTLVCYKETHANAKIDPAGSTMWTGTWRDKRFSPPADGGKPENALTGTIFTVNASPADAAIRVTGAFASQPFWRNTRVAALSASGSTTLTAGTLGYEWDENLNNGSRPAGLTTLSSTTVSVPSKLQDNGSTYAAGSATHNLTLYRHSSGAWVFGAGTVQWAWGLDNDHDRGSAPADLAMKQAIVNLFADMGAGAATLQAGLVPGSPDSQAPMSLISSPVQGASLPSGTPVTITGTAADTGGGTVTKVEVSTNGGTTWANASGTNAWTFPWTPSTQGMAVLRSRATDASGNIEAPSGGISVTITPPVPDTTLPTVAISFPGTGATVAGTAVTVSASASDNIGVVGVLFKIDGATIGAEDTVAPYSVTWNTVGLADGGHSLTATARDAAGNTATSILPVTVVNGATGPSVDATSFGDRSSASTTVVTSAFSTTSANELLLAFVASDQATSTPITATGVTGAGLTWQLVARTNAQSGTAEIWRAFATAPLSNVTVTATLSQSVTSSLTVVSFTGVDTSGSNGSGAIGGIGTGNAKPGAPSATLVATRAKSLVFGVGVDYDTATARTVGSGQTMVHQYLAPVGDTYWVQRVTGFTAASGTSITVNDTAPAGDRYNMTTVEIRSTLITDTTFPTVAITTPVDSAPVSGTVSVSANAADNIAVAGVQFKLDGVNLGTEVTASPYSILWNSATATNGDRVLTAVARDGAGNATTSAGVHVTVNNVDAAPPTVVMTAPAANATVSGASVTVSATATDDIGVAGVQFLLDDSTPIGAEDTTAPYSVTWNAAAASVSLGGHTLSARARDITGNMTTSASINVTVAAAPALAIDAVAFGDQPQSSATSVTSQSFSTTAANELLLAFVSADYSSGTSTTVTGVTGGGLTWQLVVRTNVQRGTAEIWRAFAAAPVSNATVTASISQAAASSVTIMSFIGVDTTGTNGSGAIGATGSANAAAGAPTGSIVTSRNNSWVVAVGTDWDAPVGRTLGPNQVMVHQYMPPVGDTYWVQRSAAVTPLAGTTVTMNATAPTADRYNLSICEVLSK